MPLLGKLSFALYRLKLPASVGIPLDHCWSKIQLVKLRVKCLRRCGWGGRGRFCHLLSGSRSISNWPCRICGIGVVALTGKEPLRPVVSLAGAQVSPGPDLPPPALFTKAARSAMAGVVPLSSQGFPWCLVMLSVSGWKPGGSLPGADLKLFREPSDRKKGWRPHLSNRWCIPQGGPIVRPGSGGGQLMKGFLSKWVGLQSAGGMWRPQS